MAIPSNKTELLSEIRKTYLLLKSELSIIPAELTGIRELEEHAKDTIMSIENQVAYLIGWGELVLKWHKNEGSGQAIDFPETGFQWNELGQLAQKFYQDYETFDYQELLIKLDSTVNQLLKLVDSFSTEELYGKTWYRAHTRGRMIQFNTSSPYKNSRNRIRKWKRNK